MPKVTPLDTEPPAQQSNNRIENMSIEKFAITRLSIRNERVRQFLAELLGSFILAFVGIGVAFSLNSTGGGSSIHGALAGGLGVVLGIMASAKASGGHINPAVTAAHFILGRMGKGLIGNIVGAIVYLAAQFLGMFLAAAIAYAIYHSSIDTTSESSQVEKQGSVCLFATCPTEAYPLSSTSMFFDQVFGSAILATTVLAVTDPFNANPPGMAPWFIGMSATTIGLSFGSNAGGAINSARDFAPRCFAGMLYGDVAFAGLTGTNSEFFFWIPLLGPIIGGFLAGLTYLFCVCAHWPQHRLPEEDASSIRKEADNTQHEL